MLKQLRDPVKDMTTRRTRVLGTVITILLTLFSLTGLLIRNVSGSLSAPEVNVNPLGAVVGQEVTVQARVVVGGG